MAGSFTRHEKKELLDIARASIGHGIARGKVLPVNPDDFPESLRVSRATFVTLKLEGQLRGCMGSLVPYHTLVEEIARNAFTAAMRDPRFEPVTDLELHHLQIHLSILTDPVPMTFTDEADLIGQLRPYVDGLVLETNGHRGTFLPAVWETLPEPAMFLRHLKLKANLDPAYWSQDVKISRYEAESIE